MIRAGEELQEQVERLKASSGDVSHILEVLSHGQISHVGVLEAGAAEQEARAILESLQPSGPETATKANDFLSEILKQGPREPKVVGDVASVTGPARN